MEGIPLFERYRKPAGYALFGCTTLLYILISLQNAGASLMAFIRPLGAVTGVLAAASLIGYRLFPKKVWPELWLYGLYIVAACVPGLFTAADRAAHIDMTMRFAQSFVMAASVYAAVGVARSVKPLLWMLILGAAAYLAVGLSGGFYFYRNTRQTIGNLNANQFARVPFFALMAALGLMNLYRGWKRLAFIPVLAGCAYMILISGSRAALLCCGAGVLAFIALTAREREYRRFYLKTFLPVCIGAAAVGAVVMYFTNIHLFHGIVRRISMLFSDGNGSGSYRVEAAKLALDTFLTHPLTGIGAYQFASFSGETLSGVLNHCHCDIAELLMSFGLLGTLCYAGAAVFGARGSIRLYRRADTNAMAAAMVALFLAYIVMGIGECTIYEVNCQMVWGGMLACGLLERLEKGE